MNVAITSDDTVTYAPSIVDVYASAPVHSRWNVAFCPVLFVTWNDADCMILFVYIVWLGLLMAVILMAPLTTVIYRDTVCDSPLMAYISRLFELPRPLMVIVLLESDVTE